MLLILRGVGLLTIMVCIGIVLKAQVDYQPDKKCTLCKDECMNPGFCDDRSNCGLLEEGY